MENRLRLVALLATALFAASVNGCAGSGNSDGTGGTSAGTGGSGTGGTATGGNGTGGTSTGGTGTGGSNTGGTGTGGAKGGATGSGGTGTGGTSTGGSSGTGGSGTGGAAGAAGHGGAGGTGGAAGGSSTGGAAGSSGPSSCLDDMQNGSETGVDCGGSCPTCPNYKINPPNLKNNASSGCSGGTGFMCVRSMVFSPEMKAAEADDFPGTSANPQFVYGVVGHDKDQGGVDSQSGGTCCQCYQLVFVSNSDNVSGVATPKPMIVQAFNTGAGTKNFDIFMGDGGEGAFTSGCSAMYTNYPTTGQPGNGGIRALTVPACMSGGKTSATTIAASACQSGIMSGCDMITASNSSVQSTTQNSCMEVSQPQNLYHLNWTVMVKRVECPANLTRVTGCKLNSQGLPAPDPTAVDMTSASSKGFSSGYTTTTMQDCCRPTCSYNANVQGADSQYGAYYTCDGSGNPS
jgi:hypothetical protein